MPGRPGRSVPAARPLREPVDTPRLPGHRPRHVPPHHPEEPMATTSPPAAVTDYRPRGRPVATYTTTTGARRVWRQQGRDGIRLVDVSIEGRGRRYLIERELEQMTGELAKWQTTLPERSRFAIMAALRQALGTAVRWQYMSTNPAVLVGRNRQPPPRPVRAYARDELDAIAAELRPPTGRCQSSPPRPACDRRSGRRSNGAMWTAKRASSTSAVPCRAARSWSWARPTPAGGRCRCRPGPSTRSMACR
jgi:hypothetical protein